MAAAHFNNFSWPSLYPPAIEIGFFGPPDRPGGYYLTDPDAVFKFTLYWTLIFHLPFNLFAGLYAFINFSFPPVRSAETVELRPLAHRHSPSHSRSQSHTQSPSHALPPPASPPEQWPKPRINAARSRITFALLVLLAFLIMSVLSAVVGAAVLAFVLVGFYRAGGFYMSTWVPFVWAVIQSLVALLEIWPSVVDVI